MPSACFYSTEAYRGPATMSRAAALLAGALALAVLAADVCICMKLPVAQSAVGRPPSPGCDPCAWALGTSLYATEPSLGDPLKPVARSLDDNPALVMLDVLSSYVVPEERKLETPVQFSFVHVMHSSWWDALAPFNDTANPILPEAQLPRQPTDASTNSNMNTVWLYTLLRMCEWFLPAAAPGVRNFMIKFRLNPDLTSLEPVTMPGIGNYVADAWIKHSLQDGLNRDGSQDHSFNRRNYSDSSPVFVPANDAFSLKNLTKWQPLLETNELGYFFSQVHITPQIGRAQGFAVGPDNVDRFESPAPYPAEGTPSEATLKVMKEQTDQVLDVSAKLTDAQKLQAEWYDDKLVSLAPVAYFLAIMNQWDTHTLLGATMAMNCVYDATIAAWKEKIRHNAVRPVSLVRHFYNNSTVSAYAGRNAGTQEMTGLEWNSYLRTMPHAEYPSGTSTVCAAYAGFMKKFLGTNTLKPPVRVSYRKGCSRREPGVTPAQDLPVEISDLDAMVEACGLSRNYAGVHFIPSITEGEKLGAAVAHVCWAKYQQIAGLTASGSAASPNVTG